MKNPSIFRVPCQFSGGVQKTSQDSKRSLAVGIFSGAHFAELLSEAANAEGFGRVDVVVCNAGTGGCRLAR